MILATAVISACCSAAMSACRNSWYGAPGLASHFESRSGVMPAHCAATSRKLPPRTACRIFACTSGVIFVGRPVLATARLLPGQRFPPAHDHVTVGRLDLHHI